VEPNILGPPPKNAWTPVSSNSMYCDAALNVLTLASVTPGAWMIDSVSVMLEAAAPEPDSVPSNTWHPLAVETPEEALIKGWAAPFLCDVRRKQFVSATPVLNNVTPPAGLTIFKSTWM